MNGKIIVVIAAVLVLLAVGVYFAMRKTPSTAILLPNTPIMPPVTAVPVGTPVVWSTEEKPSGYPRNTLAGYPKNISLDECKIATSLMPGAVGLAYNTSRGACYPKSAMDPANRAKYSDVVAYRKL